MKVVWDNNEDHGKKIAAIKYAGRNVPGNKNAGKKCEEKVVGDFFDYICGMKMS